jgi:ABC-type Fe3+-hydroxamate transport system substrate-binding protein
LAALPQRIISLVPSQTELLFDLGLADKIVGITKFCIHPAAFCKSIPKIGGTKNFNFELIEQLKPDLIIGNKEENYKEGIEQLQEKYKVWISDIFTLEDALEMIVNIGQLTHTTAKANDLSQRIRLAFHAIKSFSGKKAAYFIWCNPYMAVGANTFIYDMLTRCGFENVFLNLNRYPIITADMLAAINPEYIFLSSEPYPFSEKHVAEFGHICPDAVIKIVDGEMFSWYGSRLLQSASYFQKLIQELDTKNNHLAF